MFRLVGSGYATPGLSGWEQFDSMALDVLLDFGYGMLVEGAEKKDREEIDRSLAALDAPSAETMVTITRRDGSTVRISEKRLAEIQANVTNISRMKPGR